MLSVRQQPYCRYKQIQRLVVDCPSSSTIAASPPGMSGVPVPIQLSGGIISFSFTHSSSLLYAWRHLQCRGWKKDKQYVDDRYSATWRRHSGTAEIIRQTQRWAYPGTARLINTIPGMLSLNCAGSSSLNAFGEQSTRSNAGELTPQWRALFFRFMVYCRCFVFLMLGDQIHRFYQRAEKASETSITTTPMGFP